MDPSPPHFISQTLVFSLSLCSMVFLGGLKNIRTQMTIDDHSPFHVAFLIIAVVTLLVSEITALILFWTKFLSSYYATLKFVGIFSAFLAGFSLLLVIGDSFKDNFYLLIGYVMLGITLAYTSSGDDAHDKSVKRSSLYSIMTHLGLSLVQVALVFVFFIPPSLDWMVYSVIYTSLGMHAICFMGIYFKEMRAIKIQDNHP